MSASKFQFLAAPKELTLLNSTDEDISIQWSGETRLIPASNRITLPHPKYSDVSHSARDENGKFIPGTLVLHDIYVVNETTGQESLVWSAANAVKGTLGIDVKTGVATSRYAERGISLVPPGASRDEIRKIALDGRKRWDRWRLAQAFNIVASHNERNEKRRRMNLGESPASREYLAADRLIKEAAEASLEEAKQIVYEDNNLMPFTTRLWEEEDATTTTSVAAVESQVSDIFAEPVAEPEPVKVEPTLPAGIAETARIMEEIEKEKAERAAKRA